MTGPTVLRAARWADVDAGQVRSPAVVVVDGERISAINPEGPLPESATVVDLGDVTLLPKVLDAASRFTTGPDDAAMSALADRTAADPLFV